MCRGRYAYKFDVESLKIHTRFVATEKQEQKYGRFSVPVT